MPEPHIPPAIILDTLDAPITPENRQMLAQAALLMMVNCYDQKFTREEFIHAAHAALGMHAACAQLDSITSMRGLFGAKILTDEAFVEATKRLVMRATELQTFLIKLLDRAVDCPTSLDKVH
jgi:hypothetical protein